MNDLAEFRKCDAEKSTWCLNETENKQNSTNFRNDSTQKIFNARLELMKILVKKHHFANESKLEPDDVKQVWKATEDEESVGIAAKPSQNLQDTNNDASDTNIAAGINVHSTVHFHFR